MTFHLGPVISTGVAMTRQGRPVRPRLIQLLLLLLLPRALLLSCPNKSICCGGKNSTTERNPRTVSHRLIKYLYGQPCTTTAGMFPGSEQTRVVVACHLVSLLFQQTWIEEMAAGMCLHTGANPRTGFCVHPRFPFTQPSGWSLHRAEMK